MGKKKVYIAVNGCQENHMDAALVQQYLGSKNEFEISRDISQSDLVLVLGCAVTSHVENETIDIVEYLRKKKRPNARLQVIGCVSKIRTELAQGESSSDIPLQSIEDILRMEDGADDFTVNSLYESSEDVLDWAAGRKRDLFKSYVVANKKGFFSTITSPAFNFLYNFVRWYKEIIESSIEICNEKTFCIKVSTGCVGQCSYCSIRQSRGKIKSKAIDDVLAEFQKGLDQGYRDFALLGTDVGDYGKDLGINLIDLLKRIVNLKVDFRLKLRNINPRWLIASYEKLCNVLSSSKIVYIQSPVQSGNNKILDLMNRGYRAEDFKKAAETIHRRFPAVFLRTQVIVGFPSETDKQFNDSMVLCDTGIFNYVDVFRYTKRPGTKAASFEDEVPFDIIMKRYRKLFLKTLFANPMKKISSICRLKSKKAF